ncbi:UFGT [Symbiodinium natans]|uniref:UFGT protein n=1 Tax=Symbiodinium natans TaxID=878477 RepID=A0A812K0G6_9DINO|nr:UFGT [Symbiodinium natans]
MAKIMDRAQRQVIKEKLASFDLLKDLPLAAKEELVSVVEQVHYPQGSVLFYEGESSFDLYLVLDGEVKVHKKSPAEEQDEGAPATGRTTLGRKMSLVVPDEEEQYGRCIGTMGAGQAVGVVALMQSQPRLATALCSQPSEMILIRKPEFTRLIKEPMSRDWVEKDRFLQDHLVGIREHAKSFVPITGKSHATHMFVKKKYPPGHVFLHEGQVAEGALYVVFQGSVEFFRAASGTGARLREAWKNPVMEQRKPLGLLQPTSSGILAREYRLCAMLSGGLFSSASVVGTGEKAMEEFSVIAGPKGCEVFESVGDNFQKLPLKAGQ